MSPKLQTFIWLVGAPRKVQTPSCGSSQALLPSPCHQPIHPFHSHALSSLQEFSCAIPSPLFKEFILGSSGLSFCLFFWMPFFIFIKSESTPGSFLSEQGLTLLSLLPASTSAAPSPSRMSPALPHLLFLFLFLFLPHHKAYRILVPRPGIELASPCVFHIGGLPWWLSGKESTCQCRRLRFNSWVGKIPWRRKWQPTAVFLPGEVHEQGA